MHYCINGVMSSIPVTSKSITWCFQSCTRLLNFRGARLSTHTILFYHQDPSFRPPGLSVVGPEVIGCCDYFSTFNPVF